MDKDLEKIIMSNKTKNELINKTIYEMFSLCTILSIGGFPEDAFKIKTMLGKMADKMA